jgi:hypothetical protein
MGFRYGRSGHFAEHLCDCDEGVADAWRHLHLAFSSYHSVDFTLLARAPACRKAAAQGAVGRCMHLKRCGAWYRSDLPLRRHFRDALTVEQKLAVRTFMTRTERPNKAPEPTTNAVTPRAPSSTSRASQGRGSS